MPAPPAAGRRRGPQARAQVDDERLVALDVDDEAGGVAAVAAVPITRARARPPHAVERDVHPLRRYPPRRSTFCAHGARRRCQRPGVRLPRRRARRRAPRPLPARLPRHGPHLAPPPARAGRRRLPRRGAVPAGLRPDVAGRRRALPGGRPGAATPTPCTRRSAAAATPSSIGHDWGALATYGAAAHQPERWRRVVTAAVPPTASIGMSLLTYAQLQKSWYMFFFQSPLAETALPLDDYAFIDGLWPDWSPGYDAAWDVARVKESIGDPERILAAIGYYRAMFDPSSRCPSSPTSRRRRCCRRRSPPCTCTAATTVHAAVAPSASPLDFLAEGSEVEVVDDAGHFLHLEQPDVVNRRILDFLDRLTRRLSGSRRTGSSGRRTTGRSPRPPGRPPPARPALGRRASRRPPASALRPHGPRAQGVEQPPPALAVRALEGALRRADGLGRQGSAPAAGALTTPGALAAPAGSARSRARGRAHGGAEVEHGLVARPRPPGGTSRSARAVAARTAERRARHGAGQHPHAVGVDGGHVVAEGEGEHGPGRVGPDARQRPQGRVVVGTARRGRPP